MDENDNGDFVGMYGVFHEDTGDYKNHFDTWGIAFIYAPVAF
jgi:hypothetical protein